MLGVQERIYKLAKGYSHKQKLWEILSKAKKYEISKQITRFKAGFTLHGTLITFDSVKR